MNKLTTKAEYDKLPPFAQGYVNYMEAAHKGSELKGLSNPYVDGTAEQKLFREGQMQAVLSVQDEDDG